VQFVPPARSKQAYLEDLLGLMLHGAPGQLHLRSSTPIPSLLAPAGSPVESPPPIEPDLEV
jgi:hypothetical protein